MPVVTYVEHDDTVHKVELLTGTSVMLGAVDNDIPGIEADCGGLCACATCHVYVDPEWLSRIQPAREEEIEMLGFVEHANSGSRLSCQVEITDDLNGLIVRLPEAQY